MYFLFRFVVLVAVFYFVSKAFGLFKKPNKTTYKDDVSGTRKLEQCPDCGEYMSNLKSHKCDKD